MIDIQILENDDTILPTDWCRPLQLMSMSGGMSDSYSFKSCYGGTPENNVKWVLVKHIFGECWFGESVKKLNKECGKYEFIRGNIPNSHKLNMKGYSKW